MSAIRQMRHHGLRIVISTQSPKSIPGEILDLSSVVLLHRFHAVDWFSYLRTKFPLDPSRDYDRILALGTGEALVFFSKWNESGVGGTEKEVEKNESETMATETTTTRFDVGDHQTNSGKFFRLVKMRQRLVRFGESKGGRIQHKYSPLILIVL